MKPKLIAFICSLFVLTSCAGFNPLVPKGSSSQTNSSTNTSATSQTSQPILWSKLGSDSEISNSQIGSNLTRVGSVSYKSGTFGNGAEFTGTTSHLWLPSTVAKPTNGAVEFWFTTYFDKTNIAQIKALIDTDGSGGLAQNRLALCWDQTGVINFFAFNPGALTVTSPSFSSNRSFHFALVWDAAGISGSSDTVRLYLDGSLLASGTTAINQSPNYSQLYIGHHAASFGNADGIMDNLKIWNYAKTNFSDRFAE
ncbi:MAG: hypothetical protein JNM63_11800 [Spirochaetia bacterium]|nr:hypothetical protein [Spirochaetia bacterium]